MYHTGRRNGIIITPELHLQQSQSPVSVKVKSQALVKCSQVKSDKCQVNVTKMEFSQPLVKSLEKISHTNNSESQETVH
jgi:hypothetical protein